MKLTDRDFIYPDYMPADEVVARIKAVFNGATANREVWFNERFDWANYVYRSSFEWGVHPRWQLLSLQRERGILHHVGTDRDFDFAQGVVGQDEPGTNDLKKTGLPTQLFLSARGTAWSGNIGPKENFGFRAGLWPTYPRWKDGLPNLVQLYDDSHRKAAVYQAKTKAEFIQLQFTPHLEVLDLNSSINAACIAPFFQ